jgi:ethanolamine utilization microcompartment shell protein EutL
MGGSRSDLHNIVPSAHIALVFEITSDRHYRSIGFQTKGMHASSGNLHNIAPSVHSALACGINSDRHYRSIGCQTKGMKHSSGNSGASRAKWPGCGSD